MPTSLPLRVGIIGAGAFVSRRHLPDVQRDGRAVLCAACRRDPAALATVADHFHIPGRYADWRSMLDREQLDAVIIATPHDKHAEQAAEALSRGLHVLLEKPMALTVDEANDVANAACRSGCVLEVALNGPYWRHTQAMRDGIFEGKVGRLEHVEICWIGSAAAVFGRAPLPDNMPGIVRPTLFRADPHANGGGFLFDGGGHLFSEMLWVTGQQPVQIYAMMDRVPDDMRSSIDVRMDGGLIVHITAIGDSAYQNRRIRSDYFGSAGALSLSGLPFAIEWREPAHEQTVSEEQMGAVPTPVSDWIDCIVESRLPRGSAEHALAVTRLLTAAYESARTKRAIDL